MHVVISNDSYDTLVDTQLDSPPRAGDYIWVGDKRYRAGILSWCFGVDGYGWDVTVRVQCAEAPVISSTWGDL